MADDSDECEFVDSIKKAVQSWRAKLQQNFKKEDEEEPRPQADGLPDHPLLQADGPWIPKPPDGKPPPRGTLRPVAKAQSKTAIANAMKRHWSATEYGNQILNQTDSDESKPSKPTPDKPWLAVALASKAQRRQQQKEQDSRTRNPSGPDKGPAATEGILRDLIKEQNAKDAAKERSQHHNCANEEQKEKDSNRNELKPVKTQVALASKEQRCQQQKEKNSNRNERILQDLMKEKNAKDAAKERSQQHNCANEEQKEKDKNKETAKEKEKDKERPTAQWSRPENTQRAWIWIEKKIACQCGAEPVHPHDECNNGGARSKSAPTGPPKGRIRLADGPKKSSKSEPKKRPMPAQPGAMPPPKVRAKVILKSRSRSPNKA